MKNKKIIVMIFLLILCVIMLFPTQIAKIYGSVYMKTHFPKMKIECTNIEWSKYHDDYIIYFKDKDSNTYSCTIGPKYFPIILGQGLFSIEEIYRDYYSK